MSLRPRQIARDERGGVLVEVTLLLVILFTFVLGSVDFLYAMYQWNAAQKAVQVGARIASVSNPVAGDLLSITGMEGGLDPGDAMPAGTFATRTCSGATGTCSSGSYNAAAMATIVNGRCAAASAYCAGMNDMFPRVQTQNVVVSYESTGLGVAGRPGGPVPTITVSLTGLNFQFFFLNFGTIAIPPLTTTVTGEDLSFSAPVS